MEKNLLRGSAQNNNESESQPKLDGRNISESISSKKLGDDQSGILPDFSSELTRLYDLKEAGTTYYEVPNQNILTEKTVNTKRFESLTPTAIFADRRIQQLRFIQKHRPQVGTVFTQKQYNLIVQEIELNGKNQQLLILYKQFPELPSGLSLEQVLNIFSQRNGVSERLQYGLSYDATEKELQRGKALPSIKLKIGELEVFGVKFVLNDPLSFTDDEYDALITLYDLIRDNCVKFLNQENQKNDNPREIDYRLFNVKEVYKHIFYNLLDADMNQVVLELVGPSYTEMSLAKTHKIYDDFIRRQAVNALGVTEEQSREMDIQDLYTIRLYPHIQHIGLNI